MVKPFTMDGIEYNVSVDALDRAFTITDAVKAKATQDGEIYRDLVGTYYNYSMVVSERNGDRAALDSFWDAISKPVPSHVCTFPYNQDTITQRMYVTAGKQAIRQINENSTVWDSITISFVAKSPKVLP